MDGSPHEGFRQNREYRNESREKFSSFKSLNSKNLSSGFNVIETLIGTASLSIPFHPIVFHSGQPVVGGFMHPGARQRVVYTDVSKSAVRSGASRERENSALSGGELSGALCHQAGALYKSRNPRSGIRPDSQRAGERRECVWFLPWSLRSPAGSGLGWSQGSSRSGGEAI